MSTAKNPAGPWTPPHRLMNEGGWDDCCPFWDDDGQGYFVGTCFKDGYNTWLFKLTPDGSELVPAWRLLLNQGSHREANKLYKINGTYYHLFSQYKPGIGRYVMMQRATNIAGPYLETRQLNQAQPEFREPNQGGVVQTQMGDWFFFTHHGTGKWEGRCASLLPFTWVDGWPILGQVGGDGIGIMVQSGPKPVTGASIAIPQTDDDFNGSKLGAQWEWNYQPRADKWSLTERPGFLRLHASKPLERDNLKKAGNTLTQRSFRASTNVVTVALDLSGMADGQVAGLCHYSAGCATIAVRREGGVLALESARDKSITRGPVLNTQMIWLRSTWGLDGKSDFAYSTTGTAFVSFGESYQLAWGDYRGDRIGIFTYNNDSEAGHLDVDWFSYHYDSPATSALSSAASPPLVAQTPASAGTANGIMLGSWNTRVEFAGVKVVCGTNVVLDDSFANQTNWRSAGGDWQISAGAYCQLSQATPALAKCFFKNQGTNYTVSVRARKTGGAEGFLVGFGARNNEDYYWLNLGGWNNTRYRLEKSVGGKRNPFGPEVNGSIEAGRWYDVTIAVAGRRIQCFLDEKKYFDLQDAGFGGEAAAAALPADNDKINFGQALIPDMVADPSIVDLDGTFDCYATTDGWGQGLATSGTPVVWQSKDFLNWSFESSSFPSDFDLKYWAPSTVVQRNGCYYSFPTLDSKITVVVADSPTGPFLAPDSRHVTRANRQLFPIEPNTIDAEVFVDDDGQAYMVWQLRHMAKLKPDLLLTDGPTITIPTKRQGYSEGPFLTKRKGIYYYFYTLGGDENYQYAYMMSRTSPMGPWEAPAQDIIATTDHAAKIFGPGHECFFHPKDSDQWYFVYLEYGRGGTTRQIYADKMNFNPDGTIQPIQLSKAGVGALRSPADASPNLALRSSATASSIRQNYRVRPRQDATLDRVETYAPANAINESNGTRWLAAAGDTNPWWQVDLGAPRDIRRTEAFFVKPAADHAYRIEWSLDGLNWQPYGGHDDVILRSPHRDEKAVRVRYLKLTILKGEPGLWEFRIY